MAKGKAKAAAKKSSIVAKAKGQVKQSKTSKTLKAKAVKAKAPKVSASKAPAKVTKVKAPESKQIEQAKAALKNAVAVETAAKLPTEVPKAPKSRGRKISIDANPNEAASALAAKWSNLFKKSEQIESKPYNMTAIFEEKTAIVHKVLGWGYILANRNDRLEVLFKDGIRYLISNYKP